MVTTSVGMESASCGVRTMWPHSWQTPQESCCNDMYSSLARWAFRRGRLVIAAWIILLFGINAMAGVIGAAFSGEFSTPESESTRGFAVLNEYFPGSGSAFGGNIVFQSDRGVDDPEVVAEMSALFAEVDAIEGLGVVSPYSQMGASQISADGLIAFAQVNVANNIDQVTAAEIGADIREMVPALDGVTVEVGGAVFSEFAPPESEMIGLAFAIVILIVAFGSVMAMGLPIAVALAGVGTGGFGVVSLMSHGLSIPEFAPLIGIMIGLGVGIDYALFMVTRYRELTRAGYSPEDATAGSLNTAGRAVVFAGITVVLSLLGMITVGLEFVAGLGIAAAATVAVTLIASITLVPALLGVFHSKVEVTRWRGLISAGCIAIALLGVGLGIPALSAIGGVFAIVTLLGSIAIRPLRKEVPSRRERPLRETASYRWSRQIQRKPWLYAALGGGVLALLALPVLSLRLGFSDEGNFSEETPARRAYDLIADGFGPGFNGPLLVALETSEPGDVAYVQGLVTSLASDAGIDRVAPPFPSDIANPAEAEAWIIQVIPTSSPQDEATAATVERLRAEVLPSALSGSGITASVTGAAAANIDFTAYMASRIFVFFGAVLGVSFLLLMMVFRSVLVPLKAVLMNVLSIASAYGVAVAIFQWGWLSSVFGVEPAPIEPFVPLMLFAIVFGLSMDYEVFLLSRVKEEYDRTGDPTNSVADGLAATARVISAAAAIMVVVFGAFLLEDDRIVKLFGVGLAVAVLLDATLVRMLLVPATMALLGRGNWWIPQWLDRVLPNLNVEGESHAESTVLAQVEESSESESDREPLNV